ncbi:protein FAM76B-like [Mercenaria mercenaria]|uniref:protein FAM76B-like n=1 Tax=Mercenaria mercenaria TaxID=6596 RepID=UPI00234F359D|nr:protein FAM76B-like [Mercenaria mercenaria]
MAALFACTKCHSRHPFEQLSTSEQLCKGCRNYQPVVKCTACRAEFTPGERGATNQNCRHCTYNIKVHGEPAVCRFCNLMAAFVDNKCQRCTAYEKKFGAPLPCEQCKMKCAFDKSERSKAKMDGKTLCWLCALAYKRVLEKAKQRQEQKRQGLRSNPSSFDKLDKLDKSDKLEKVENMSTGSNSRDKISPFENASNSQPAKTPQKDSKSLLNLSVGEKSTPPSFASSFDFLREHKDEKSNDSIDVATKVKEEGSKDGHHKHRHHHHHHHKSKHHHHKRSHSPRSPSKRPRLENSDSNGMTGTLTPTKSSVLATEKSPVDPNSSEHIIAINRLQEQLDNLKKQLSLKDQQLLEKEKKMTEVKAAQYESDKSFRTKLSELTKKNTEAVETLQAKNRELEKKNRDLSKQVTLLSKGKKSSSVLSNSQNNSPSLSS